ncbi:GFA family protein [Burkholderia alba]|uniref:GFA family protein n=1 Tax=Burkholderia alba TaxID=2683677 RepID=UPI002B053606|nr:GFA family protein [Burkholderia alba]
MSTRIASCSCGQLTATVDGDPIRVSVCHCLACQRRTGSVFGAQARFARANVRFSGQGREFVRVGDEGGQCTFTFCPACGATVHYTIAGFEGFVGIPVGAFADPAFPSPSFSVYEDRMHAWVRMPDGIEHMH